MNKNSIYGAIIGDIVGSYQEVLEIKAKECKTKISYNERCKFLNQDTPLFTQNCSLTDDSVLTIAIADAILTNKSYESKLKEYGKKEINMGLDKYGRSRFGKCFCNWIYGNFKGDSYGNGCAMRISPVAYMYNSLEKTLAEAEKATVCSHNHPDSIKCARAVCGSIFLARTGAPKEQIKQFAQKELDLLLDFDLEYLLIGMTVVILILVVILVLLILQIKKTKKLQKRLDKFLLGKDGRSLEDNINMLYDSSLHLSSETYYPRRAC